MAGDIHVGDTPLDKFLIHDQAGAIKDISAASTLNILYKRPNGTTFVRTATLTTDGTDGLMHYQTVTADYDMAGDWLKEPYVAISGDSTEWGGTIIKFEVKTRLPTS